MYLSLQFYCRGLVDASSQSALRNTNLVAGSCSFIDRSSADVRFSVPRRSKRVHWQCRRWRHMVVKTTVDYTRPIRTVFTIFLKKKYHSISFDFFYVNLARNVHTNSWQGVLTSMNEKVSLNDNYITTVVSHFCLSIKSM